MDWLETLPFIDLASFAVLALIFTILIVRRFFDWPQKKRSQPERTQAGAQFIGGAPLAPDVSLTKTKIADTNDPMLLVHAPASRYVGPDQIGAAFSLLDPPNGYSQVAGHVTADLPLLLDPDARPGHIGSTDPAAAAALMLISAESNLAEEALEDAEHPALWMLRLCVILLLLLPLLLRVLT